MDGLLGPRLSTLWMSDDHHLQTVLGSQAVICEILGWYLGLGRAVWFSGLYYQWMDDGVIIETNFDGVVTIIRVIKCDGKFVLFIFIFYQGCLNRKLNKILSFDLRSSNCLLIPYNIHRYSVNKIQEHKTAKHLVVTVQQYNCVRTWANYSS